MVSLPTVEGFGGGGRQSSHFCAVARGGLLLCQTERVRLVRCHLCLSASPPVQACRSSHRLHSRSLLRFPMTPKGRGAIVRRGAATCPVSAEPGASGSADSNGATELSPYAKQFPKLLRSGDRAHDAMLPTCEATIQKMITKLQVTPQIASVSGRSYRRARWPTRQRRRTLNNGATAIRIFSGYRSTSSTPSWRASHI